MLAHFDNLPDFRMPFFVRNRHVQTVLSAWLPSGKHTLPTRQTLVPLPDGDQLVLHDDCPADWQSRDPAVLLIHGLAGSHASPYLIRLARKLTRNGIRSLRLDLRGAGAGTLLAARSYHCGCTEDIAAALRAARALVGRAPLLAVGFSLGGNALLKTLGEAGDPTHSQPTSQHGESFAAAEPEHVPLTTAELPHAALAICPPLDMLRSSALLTRGFNRFYDRFFTRILYNRLRFRASRRDDVPLAGLTRRPRSLRELDDVYTAPTWGFAGVEDYYIRAAARHTVGQIPIPTRIVTADDDPMIPVDTFHELPRTEHVDVTIIPGGGHTGFIGYRGSEGDRHWIEWRIVELACSLRDQPV